MAGQVLDGGGTGVVQNLQACDQALPAHSRRRGPKPERGGRSWPHVIPVGFGDLEASGGWIRKWGKGQSVAPAVASLQGRWVEDGWRPAGPDTHRPALGWLSATQGRPRDLEEARAASAVRAGGGPGAAAVSDPGFCSLGDWLHNGRAFWGRRGRWMGVR